MLNKKFTPLLISCLISPLALADDCGESVYLGQQYKSTNYKHHCIVEEYGEEVSRKTIESSRNTGVLCPLGTTRREIESEHIYESVYDNAPIAGYRISRGQHADGYSWTRVFPQASDDNGIDSANWAVDGVTQHSSSLYFRNSKRVSQYRSVNYKVIDTIGQECNANFNLRIDAPSCGTRGSEQGCN
jgi:hypothetical protein